MHADIKPTGCGGGVVGKGSTACEKNERERQSLRAQQSERSDRERERHGCGRKERASATQQSLRAERGSDKGVGQGQPLEGPHLRPLPPHLRHRPRTPPLRYSAPTPGPHSSSPPPPCPTAASTAAQCAHSKWGAVTQILQKNCIILKHF